MNGEGPEDVVLCLVEDPRVKRAFDELPEREFYDGYGSAEGELVLVFTRNWVYFKATYDGLKGLPSVGGG
jgi:hypothetical protein